MCNFRPLTKRYGAGKRDMNVKPVYKPTITENTVRPNMAVKCSALGKWFDYAGLTYFLLPALSLFVPICKHISLE